MLYVLISKCLHIAQCVCHSYVHIIIIVNTFQQGPLGSLPDFSNILFILFFI